MWYSVDNIFIIDELHTKIINPENYTEIAGLEKGGGDRFTVENISKYYTNMNNQSYIHIQLYTYYIYVYIYTGMDEIQCRGRRGPPYLIVIEVLEPRGWCYMKVRQNT